MELLKGAKVEISMIFRTLFNKKYYLCYQEVMDKE